MNSLSLKPIVALSVTFVVAAGFQTLSQADQNLYVVPPQYEAVNGGGTSGVFLVPLRLQEVYSAALFNTGAITIQELRWRPTPNSIGPVSATITNLQLKLSTTQAQPGGLSPTFANNIGPDETVVFSGPITLSSAVSGPPGQPKAFDIIVHLSTPFTYDPAAGNLLVDVRNFGSIGIFVDAGSAGSGVSRTFSNGPDVPVGDVSEPVAEVLQLVYSAAPASPAIISQPPDQNVFEGETVNFRIVVSGTPPLSFQWFLNSNALAGATGAVLTIPSVQASDAGTYFVSVSNALGNVQSSNAVLTVRSNQNLYVVPPQYETVNGGGNSGVFIVPLRLQEVYSAALFNTGPITIQELRWRPTPTSVGPVSSTITNLQIKLSTTQVQPESLSATFASNIGPDETVVFDGPITLSSAVSGPPGQPKDFDIIVPLSAPFTYDPAAGNLLVDVRNFGSIGIFVDAGSAGNSVSRVFSNGPDAATAGAFQPVAEVLQLVYSILPAAPVIVSQPQSQIAFEGTSVSFKVGASGTRPLSYQWFLNSNVVAGATNAILTVASVQASDAGTYFVSVANPLGSVQSSNATLTVRSNQNLYVVPPQYETVSGGGNSGVFIVPLRLQEVYSAALFNTGPITIQELRWRPTPNSVGPVSATITNLQIKLSTTQVQPGSLSATFASNIGPNETVVFDGPITLSSAVSGPPGQPKAFDIIVHLSTPFTYDPAAGNLLVDVRNFGSIGIFVDAGSAGTNVSRAFSNGPNVPTAGVFQSVAEVLQLVYSAVPSAPSVSTEPQDLIAVQGDTAHFSVTASGTPPLFYQWRFESTDITGATNSVLSLTNVQPVNEGGYSVEISNLHGAVTSRVARLTVLQPRTLSVAGPPPTQEGTIISVPVELESGGEVGGMTFVLHYDTNYLHEIDLVWDKLLKHGFTTVNDTVPGEIRAAFGFSGQPIPAGTQVLANVEFLLRSVPNDLGTELALNILDASDPLGNAITVGNLTRNATVSITRRLILGDNNGNQRLDVGDATIILRLLTQLEPVRPWDVTANDLNSNGNLDVGDVIKVLLAAASADLEPQPALQRLNLASVLSDAASQVNEEMSVSPAAQSGSAGGLVTFRVQLQNAATAISGASFVLDYPTNALRLLSAESYQVGSLVPPGGLAAWNLSPTPAGFDAQDGHLSMAASSATPWPESNGVLAEITFQIQTTATNRYAWPITLRHCEITMNGYVNRFMQPMGAVFLGRAPLPGVLQAVGRPASNQFEFYLTGDPGASYLVEVSTNLVNWDPLTQILNSPGTTAIVDPVNRPLRFYRTRPLDH